MITKKIESGKQLGTALRVYKDQQYSWYEYAVQKKIIFIMFMKMRLQKRIWQEKFGNTKMYINIHL